MPLLRRLVIFVAPLMLSACAHIMSTNQSYDGVPAKEFIYLNTRYQARDIPASRRLLLSRATEGETLFGIGKQLYSKHDIDAAVRVYFADIDRRECAVEHINEVTSDSWEITYQCH